MRSLITRGHGTPFSGAKLVFCIVGSFWGYLLAFAGPLLRRAAAIKRRNVPRLSIYAS